MKNLCFIFFLLIYVPIFAQNPTPSDEKQVQQLIQNSFDGIFSTYQAELLPDFYTEDFLLLEQGEICGTWNLSETT